MALIIANKLSDFGLISELSQTKATPLELYCAKGPLISFAHKPSEFLGFVRNRRVIEI